MTVTTALNPTSLRFVSCVAHQDEQRRSKDDRSQVVQVRMRESSNYETVLQQVRHLRRLYHIRHQSEDHPPVWIPCSVSELCPRSSTGCKLSKWADDEINSSVSDPPLYPLYSSMRLVTNGGSSSTMKCPANEVVPPAPKEALLVEQCRMPRLFSARDLMKGLT